MGIPGVRRAEQWRKVQLPVHVGVTYSRPS